MSAAIETMDLRKSYKKLQALKGVNLKVERGEIFGLLGQNGAGKTTIIKILLGIVKYNEGETSLLGQPAGDANTRRKVGYLPEDHSFPLYHSAYSLLDFYGQLYGMSRDDRKKKIPELLDQVGLASRMHNKIRSYSKGMKQRTGIAQAIFHDPDLIILDEPTDGVDPVGRREIREMIDERRRQGATVFVNSHLLGEIELMCDRVAIMQKGELIREGTVKDLTSQRGVLVVGVAGNKFPEESISKLGIKLRREGLNWELTMPDEVSIDQVIDLILQEGYKLRHLVEKKQTLEDLFVATVESAEPGIDARRRQRQLQRNDNRRGDN